MRDFELRAARAATCWRTSPSGCAGTVGFEEDHVTVARVRQARREGPGRRGARAGRRGLVEQLRAVKDEAEIAAMAAAADIATAAYESLRERGLAGRTEREVALGAGALHGGPGRRAAVLLRRSWRAAAHGALPHAVPRDVEIPRDTLVVIDMGARVDGYCSDCTRTLATGDVTDEMRRGLRAGAGVRRSRRWPRRRPERSAGRWTPSRARSSTPPATASTSATGSGTAWGCEVHEAPRLAQDRRGRARGGQRRDRRAGRLPARRVRRPDRGPRRS